MNPIILFPLTVFFLWGWYTEYRYRLKIERKLKKVYGEGVKEKTILLQYISKFLEMN